MAETLVRLFEDSVRSGLCGGCRAAIDWYETLNHRNMPMNAGAVPRKSEKDPDTWRVIAFFSSDDTHWATCPARAQFRRDIRRQVTGREPAETDTHARQLLSHLERKEGKAP